MKDRPILFSAPMVRAILTGTKSQTRRIVKPQPVPFVQHTPNRHPTNRTAPYIDAYCGEKKTEANPRGMSREWHWWTADNRLGDKVALCPYGQPGDRLWVRETWRAHKAFDLAAPHELPKIDGVHYEADAKPLFWDYGKLRPSIHMPRWASRITLEITGVRVERLNDISEVDAKAEGLNTVTKDGSLWKWGIADSDGLPGNDDTGWHWQEWECDPRDAYSKLWESINGPDSWGANPWVWAVEFRRVKP